MKVLIVIPAYNEELNIVKTVGMVEQYRGKCDFQLDYVVINDGSVDNTKRICREHNINCVNLIQNLGIGGAVQTGYRYASKKDYDVAVQFDGDGQHDIESLGDLLKPILEGKANFVIGSRFIEGDSDFQSTLMRRLGIKWLSFLIRVLTGKRILDVTSGYRAADSKVLKMLAKNYPLDYPEPESIVYLLRNGLTLTEVQVNMFEREGGRSSIHSWKSVYYMLKVSLSILCARFQGKEKN